MHLQLAPKENPEIRAPPCAGGTHARREPRCQLLAHSCVGIGLIVLWDQEAIVKNLKSFPGAGCECITSSPSTLQHFSALLAQSSPPSTISTAAGGIHLPKAGGRRPKTAFVLLWCSTSVRTFVRVPFSSHLTQFPSHSSPTYQIRKWANYDESGVEEHFRGHFRPTIIRPSCRFWQKVHIERV